MKDAGAVRFSEGFWGFVARSVFLGLGGLRFVGVCGCLTDRPHCGVGLLRSGVGFVFHFASLLKQDFGGSSR